MHIPRTLTPLVRLPQKTEFILFLLREDLKSTRFFEGLNAIGLSDTPYEPYLGSLILTLMGFDTRPDDLLTFYLDRLRHHARKIGPDHSKIMKQALKFFFELRQERKARQKAAP